MKCRRLADENRWEVVAVYADAAISGASIFRDEYQRLLKDAEAGLFDIVVVEAVDRLSRRLADLANFYDIVVFRKIKLYATDRGEINALMVGLLGSMAQAFLEDLRAKTKRGLSGKIRAGLSAGSIGYGYEVDPNERGRRLIVENEAAIVRRIFSEYAAGASPRAIATHLNEEKIPGPSGALWQDTTIRGQADRGTGILNNALYIGKIEWNRCSYERNPQTGKRIARPNPPEEWERNVDESLRIVDDELWERVKTQQADVRSEMSRTDEGIALNRAHRAQHLLSGKLFCAECGESFAMRDAKHYGCSNFRSKGTCSMSDKVPRSDLERVIGSGIRHRWFDEAFVKRATAGLIAQWQEDSSASQTELAQLEGALKQTKQKIDRITLAIADEGHSRALLGRLAELETEAKRLEGKIAELDAEIPEDLDAYTVYIQDKIQEFRETVEKILTDFNEPGIQQFRERVHRMIDRIEISRQDDGKVGVAVHGSFAGILIAAGLAEPLELGSGQKNPPNRVGSGFELSVVAGAGFEPAAFRL